jgi:putative multiple sugar transport system substrate-binding protein
MRRPAAAALAVALEVALLTGCAAPTAEPVVGIALPSDAGRWARVAEVLQERIEDAGYPVELRVASDDIPTQVQQVSELLALEPLAIVVAPVDGSSLTPVLDAADPDIEVLTLDGLVRDTGAVDDHVAFDPAAGGFQQALSLLQGLGLVDEAGAALPEAPPGPFRIELFLNSPDNATSEPAYAAAMSALEPFLDSGVLIAGSGETGFGEVTTLRGDPEVAAARLTEILQDSYPEGPPDAVLAATDRIARAITGVLLGAGAVPGDDFPIVTGRGTELESLAAMNAGAQYSTLLEDPRALAEAAADRLLAALDGTTTPGQTTTVDNGARAVPATLLSPVAVRSGDIDTLVVGSGYWSRSRIDEAIAAYDPGAS